MKRAENGDCSVVARKCLWESQVIGTAKDVDDLGTCLPEFAALGKRSSLFRIAQRPYPVAMARRLNNWSYQDVTSFLKENGFSFFEELKGAHEAWIRLQDGGEPDRIVELSFRTDSYPVKAMKSIIRQSGIVEKDWVEWPGS